MLQKLDLDNFKIRTKLVALVLLPLLGLLGFSLKGYTERSSTASRATTDETIVAAAGSTATLVAAMEQEALVSIADPKSKELPKLQKTTDQAFEAFKDANGKLSFNSDSTATNEAEQGLTGLRDADMSRFTGYRDQLDKQWREKVEAYRTAGINSFVAYVNKLAGLTQTPEVVLPLQQLAAVLDYNLQTDALVALSMVTERDGTGKWDQRLEDDRPGAPPDAKAPSNHDVVYNQILQQDKANTVLVSVAGSSSPIKAYIDQNVQLDGDLNTVLTGDWGTVLPMDDNAFSRSLEQVAFPTKTVALKDGQAYVRKLAGAADDVTQRTTATIESARSAAVRTSRLYVLIAFLAIVAVIAAAMWISLSISRRLVRLTDAADRLSHEQLPRLVDSLKNPAEDDIGYLTSSFSEIDVKGTDEIGQLAGAYNRIQGVAVQVATEQAQLLRKGIGDMFVNLARRNQGLLDRQIEFIDQLESAEEDPDQLENLFRLDHLATRMRRNAESLLVLAGAEPSRRRGKPVPLADVVRAAVGEVEDFARIDMLQFDDVLVASNAALDIAHLLSELMENAANFSPPDTRVEVVGHRTKAEGYVVSVTDHGIGMAPDALAEANDLLARPPLVGLALSRSLGFIVIGRLAARFGIAVRLMPSPSSGTTAMVSLPPSLITDQPRTASTPAALTENEPPRKPVPATDDPIAIVQGTDRRPPARRVPVAPKAPVESAPPKRTPPAPTSTTPAGIPQRTPRRVPPSSAPTPTPTPTVAAPAAGADAPVVVAEAPQATSSGLTKRVPRSAGGQRAVPGGDGKRAATQNRRSPEEVRSMLSRYRSGMQQGRDDDTAKNPEDEGT